MFTIDLHLDLALNAIEWNRDLRLPVEDIRQRESGMTDKIDRGKGTVSLPALRKGNIGLVVATQIARFTSENGSLPGAGFASPHQAWAMTQAQRSWYEAMEEEGQMCQINDLASLERHIALWQNSNSKTESLPVGYILSLEGADSLISPDHLHRAYQYGLRAIGLSHYGPGRYASGTGTTDGLTDLGFQLLPEIKRLNLILDVTHLTDLGFDQVMEKYDGAVWASHHNCRTLVPHQRQLADFQLKQLIKKSAVIGACFDAWMMKPGFTQRQSDPKAFDIKIETIVDHIDHICQLAGNSHHCAFGSDLDGTFGTEQSPYDLDQISDLQKLTGILAARGYTSTDIENIFHANAISFLRRVWG